MADAVVADHLIAAICVGLAGLVAPSVNAALILLTVGVEGAGLGVCGDAAEAVVALVAIGAVAIFGAFEVAEAAGATFVDTALSGGDAELVDDLADSGKAGLAGSTVGGGLTGGVDGSLRQALALLADFSCSAVLGAFASKAAASLQAGGSVRAFGVAVADSIVDAEAVLAALSGGAVGRPGAGYSVIAVFGGAFIRRVTGIVWDASVGRAAFTAFTAVIAGLIGAWGRQGWIVGACGDADGAPAQAVLALGVIVAARGAAAVKAEGISSTLGVVVAGDLAGPIVAEAGISAVFILFTGAADDAAALVADLCAHTLHGASAIGGAIALDGAELFLKAIGVALAALGWGAEALVALSRGAVMVSLT